MKKVWVLHGPNLNLLGTREPHLYGHMTLIDLNQHLKTQGDEANLDVQSFQTQSEETFIQWIHQAYTEHVDYLILNPAAFTHTSIALRDALLATQIPFIEVHLSNLFTREKFRQNSYFSDIASGIIQGLGTDGYLLALQAIIHKLT